MTKSLIPAALESRLVTLHADKPDVAVVVRPHKELPIQKFIDVMDILQRAKISKVGVLTRPDRAVRNGRLPQ